MTENNDPIVIEEACLVNDEILELQKKIQKEPTPVPDTLDNVIIIDGLPVVGPEKLDKLKNILKRIYTGEPNPIPVKDIRFPVNEKKQTYGYAFAELENAGDVDAAVRKTNNYPFSKTLRLTVNRWSDFEKLMQVDEEYNPPSIPEYKPKEDLTWWLSDRREQYAILYGKETEIYWHEPVKPQPSLITKKSINEPYVFQWSPYGSYFAFIIRGRRVIIRGGENWSSINSYSQHGLDSCVFSPSENYIMTSLSQNTTSEKEFFAVWDIASGKKLRNFPRGNYFKWSHDDKYFARMSEDKISIYETPGCALLDKKSLVFKNIDNFEWSPASNVMAIFIQGQQNTPSFLTLIELPSRKEIYRKSLFSVKTCTMKWQSEGKYLSLQVDRYTKSKKATVTSFEIFNLSEKIITTEILLMNDEPRLFEWEPSGNRFGIIHGAKGAPRVNVSFYQMGKKKLIHHKTMENKNAKKLFWSPRGSFVVIGGPNGSLEFYNAVLNETMGEGEHYMVSALQWDPTGRYVCTYVSAWNAAMEHGYVIHTFKGDVVHKVLKDQFYDFQWRPRPKSLLTDEQESQIRSNLKEYAAKYKKEDDGQWGVIIDAKYKEQQRLLQEYNDRMRGYKETYANQREDRIAIRGGELSDDENDYETVYTTVETKVFEKEEELDF